MARTVFSEEQLASKVDSHIDRYLIEHPESERSDLLVVYIHSGLAHGGQGFCVDKDWCMGDLRDEVLKRDGVYVSPDLRGDSWMNSAAEADLRDLINTLKARFGASTVLLAGASMGGTSALIFASHHPELIDGVIALCPATDMRELFTELKSREELLYKHVARSIVTAYGGPPAKIPIEYAYRSSREQVDKLAMPIVIRHAAGDEIISANHSRKLVDILLTRSTPVRYDEVEGDHAAAVVDVPWEDYLEFVMFECD